MKKSLFLTLIFLIVIFCLTIPGFSQYVPGTPILLTVDQTYDAADASPGDGVCADAAGKCTLRAAVEETNAHPGNDTINFRLPSPSVINLTLGQINITGVVTIVGPGARNLTVRRSPAAGTPRFRIFEIPIETTPYAYFRGFKISGGFPEDGTFGGGIRVGYGTTASVIEMEISGNQAADGGGICNSGSLTVSRSLIASNQGVTGAGLSTVAGFAVTRIIDSTITLNSGGGIENLGKLILVNDTISHNTFDGAGSAVYTTSEASVYAVNTIFKGEGTLPLVSGDFTSLGNNIVTNSQGSTGFTNGVKNDQVSTNGSLDPLLGDLANNGGQTDTRALLPGSPAIDRGSDCVKTGVCDSESGFTDRIKYDQRGRFVRLAGDTVDIGALETGAGVDTAAVTFTGRLTGNLAGRLNSLIIFTDIRTGEKRYAVANPTGDYKFKNSQVSGAYLLEVRSKRAGHNDSVFLPFDDALTAFPVSYKQSFNGMVLTFALEKDEITGKSR